MAGSVQVNKKTSILCLVGFAVVLYLLYSWSRTIGSTVSSHNDVWNALPNQLPAEHRQLFDIPADILSARNEVNIKEQYITLTVGDPVNKQVLVIS